MCGISGIISKRNTPIEPALIECITDLIIHRGPDGKGYYFGPNFAFGHRRLAIIDLSEHGRQPMAFQNRYWITYNGEVYNYIEIRADLEKLGYSFRSNTDTEVILAAYAHWGSSCLSRFNGMWAFAIYDLLKQNILFARDRFGIKPLYYIDTPNQFAFGSEIKQLLALQSSVRADRKIVIEALLTSIDNHTADTYFNGVKSFPQSHYGYYDLRTHALKLHRYYELKIDTSLRTLPVKDAVSHLYELFTDAVRIRLRSDVRVGTCLSGGLDSSAISSIACQLYHNDANERFIGIHAKSIDAETDESHYANMVARHLCIDLHTVEPSTEDFLSTIDELVYTQEEPFGSPSMFMGWHVFEKAKLLGCKVMLNGQGGDEILLGYERYFAAFLRSVSLIRFFQEAYAQSRHSRLGIKDVLLYNMYFTNPSLRILRLKWRSILHKKFKAIHDFEAILKSSQSFRKIEDMQIHEISTLQLPHLLRYEDRNSMRHSIETRLPFLDYRLVEFCISIPPDYKIRDGWTKYALRKAVENVLPKQIIWRKDKLGFVAPERTWIGNARAKMKNEISNSNILREITDYKRLEETYERQSLIQQWNYFALAAWERKFGVVW